MKIPLEEEKKRKRKKKIKMLVEQLRLRRHYITRHSRSYAELAQKAPLLSCCLWDSDASHILHDQ